MQLCWEEITEKLVYNSKNALIIILISNFMEKTVGEIWLSRIENGKISRHLVDYDSLDRYNLDIRQRDILESVINYNKNRVLPSKKDICQQLDLAYEVVSDYVKVLEEERLMFDFTAQEYVLRVFGKFQVPRIKLDTRLNVRTDLKKYLSRSLIKQRRNPRAMNYPRFHIALISHYKKPVFYEMFEGFLEPYMSE